MEPLFWTNGCATRFARQSSKNSKNHCQIPDFTVSAHGFLREAKTIENGCKSPMTPSHFQASRRIFGEWWAKATSFPTSPQAMQKPALESTLVLLPQRLLQVPRSCQAGAGTVASAAAGGQHPSDGPEAYNASSPQWSRSIQSVDHDDRLPLMKHKVEIKLQFIFEILFLHLVQKRVQIWGRRFSSIVGIRSPNFAQR